MNAQTTAPSNPSDSAAPSLVTPAPAGGFSFATFLGGLVLGLVLGLFIAAYALPIIEPMLGTGPAHTGTPNKKTPSNQPRDPQPEAAPAPTGAPTTEPAADPTAAIKKPAEPAPSTPPAPAPKAG